MNKRMHHHRHYFIPPNFESLRNCGITTFIIQQHRFSMNKQNIVNSTALALTLNKKQQHRVSTNNYTNSQHHRASTNK